MNVRSDTETANARYSMLFNRPFYLYGGHIELLRFKEYYGMPRGHEHFPIYSLSIYARFSGQFFFKF